MGNDSIDGAGKNRTNSVSNVKIAYIKKYISNWPKVLDIACGYGRYSHFAQEKFHKQVTGVDIEKRKSVDFNFVQADLEKGLEQVTWTYDTVFAFDIIEHIHNEDKIIKDIAQVANDIIIISVPYKDDSALRKHYLTTVARIDPTHVRYYDGPELARKFEAHWFETLKIHREGQISPGFISEFFPSFMRKLVWVFFHGLYKLRILYNDKIAGDVFIVLKKKWT